MTLLKRHLAPLSQKAWEEIDEEARRVLTAHLAARQFVEVRGPLGLDTSAINIGRLEEWQNAEDGRIRFARRRVQPLIEIRVGFSVSRTEFENLERGAAGVNLDPVGDAARAASRFEERAVFHGNEQAGIRGMIAASEHDPIAIGGDMSTMPDRVTSALIRLTDDGVEGPYLLVLGERLYRAVAGDVSAYPLRQQLAKLVGEPPVYSPGLEDGLLVSMRGGDFELTLGIDMSIGFEQVAGDDVQLFLTETFTFQAIGGEAVVVLR